MDFRIMPPGNFAVLPGAVFARQYWGILAVPFLAQVAAVANDAAFKLEF